ncbi:MAG: nitroreductase family protein [Rikenellaceae bacterium]
MDALEMIKERRSVRKYKDQTVDRELMKEIITLAGWSPSWANFQVARYTIVDDPQMIVRFANEAVKGFVYNINTLRNAKGVLVLSYVKGKSGSLDKANYSESQSSTSWEMFDAGIACQTFCLAAHAKGVGTCIFGVIDQENIAKIVDLPANESVAALITYGYEEGEHAAPTPRKALDQIMRIAGE